MAKINKNKVTVTKKSSTVTKKSVKQVRDQIRNDVDNQVRDQVHGDVRGDVRGHVTDGFLGVDVDDEIAKKEEEDRLSRVVGSLRMTDKEELSRRLGEILDVRMANELSVQEFIREGVMGGKISVEDAAMLLNKSKDSVGDLIKVKRVVDGVSDGSEVVGMDMLTEAQVKQIELVRARVTFKE